MDGEKPSAWDDVQIEYVHRIIDELGIKNFLETGTFQGNTSLYFWRHGLKVYTVEISRESFLECVERFKGTDIEAVNMDSVEYLKEFLKRGREDTLYYLDAHWGHLPLRDELSLILKLPHFIIIVHDVQVPNQPQFSFQNDVNERFVHTPLPEGTTRIFPRYNTPNRYWPGYLVGYCILSRGYPLIKDDRFTFETPDFSGSPGETKANKPMKILIGVTSYKIHVNQPHNLYEYTAKCLNSLLRQKSRWDQAILLIDDGTEEWALKKLREDCPGDWRLVHNQTIGSFSKCLNLLARTAWEEGRDWAMWSHNDCEFTNPNTMEDLYEFLSPISINEPKLIWGQWTCPFGIRGTEAPWVTCFVINKAWWDKIGPFDERYKLYWEWDYEYRMGLAGLKHTRIYDWKPGVHYLSKTQGNFMEELPSTGEDKERFKEKWGFPVW